MNNQEYDVQKLSPGLSFPWDLDPFGIRKATLGGDVPGLQAELDFLNRRQRYKVDADKGKGREDDG